MKIALDFDLFEDRVSGLVEAYYRKKSSGYQKCLRLRGNHDRITSWTRGQYFRDKKIKETEEDRE